MSSHKSNSVFDLYIIMVHWYMLIFMKIHENDVSMEYYM